MNDRLIPRLIHVAETDSTNKYLQEIAQAEELPSGSIVLADYQTAGRGQTGNAWESEAGKNLTFSVFFRPASIPTAIPANRPFVISEMASLSLQSTLSQYIPDVTVKWPNDIYYQDRKIAGILIENTLAQGEITQSVIGIGLNVNQTEFRSNAPNPVSLAQITGTSFDKMDLLEVFRRQFTAQSERLRHAAETENTGFDAIHHDYLQVLYRKDGFHNYADVNGTFEARIHHIEPDGHLVLERTDGRLSRYAFKEVAYTPDKSGFV